MAKVRFKTDPRSDEQLVDAMGQAAARLRNKCGGAHWTRGLFERDEEKGSYALANGAEPSSALLAALAFVMAEKLLAEANQLPERARRAYLVGRLGIAEKTAQA